MDLDPVEQWRLGYNSALENLLATLDEESLILSPEGIRRYVTEQIR